MASTDILSIELELLTNIRGHIRELERIKKETNFTLVVQDVIDRIRAAQRRAAPIGKTGKGPHGRIPRSIQVTDIDTSDDKWEASTFTSYGPAVFTNMGTTKNYMMWHGGTHPGLDAQHWFEQGALETEPLAMKAFQSKVERILRVK